MRTENNIPTIHVIYLILYQIKVCSRNVYYNCDFKWNTLINQGYIYKQVIDAQNWFTTSFVVSHDFFVSRYFKYWTGLAV